MINIIGLIVISAGILWDLIGVLALIRLKDVYSRLQISTKCITLGTCVILFGSFIISGFTPAGIKSLVCIFLLFLTSPVSAHALARAAYKTGAEEK
jgi:multicomponent Na+:H+ antiporter subunit G